MEVRQGPATSTATAYDFQHLCRVGDRHSHEPSISKLIAYEGPPGLALIPQGLFLPGPPCHPMLLRLYM